MKTKTTELVFLLDCSASMSLSAQNIIREYNRFLFEQKIQNTEMMVTTVIFAQNYDFVQEQVAVDSYAPLTYETYNPRGMSALYDAIGNTLTKLSQVKTDENHQTLCIIMTDGADNASEQYNAQEIGHMIAQARENHWAFLFFGTNKESIRMAKEIGIETRYTTMYHTDIMGIRQNFMMLSDIMPQFGTTGKIPRYWKLKVSKKRGIHK